MRSGTGAPVGDDGEDVVDVMSVRMPPPLLLWIDLLDSHE